MQVSEIDRSAVRRLAELRPAGGGVLSVYLSLDPKRFPTPADRHTELVSLLAAAEGRHLLRDGVASERSRGGKLALGCALERVRRLFEEGEFSAKSAHGVAVFCYGGGGELELYKLPVSVEPQVVFADSPYVEPLVELLPGDGWGVLLVNRRTARAFRGTAESLVEIRRLVDDVHRWHAQGGWSQARFQRGIEKETADHVRHACELLFALHRRTPFKHLIVGGPREIWPEVERKLHPYLRALLVGRIEADVERSSPEEVLEAAAPLIAQAGPRGEWEALDRLEQELGTGGRAAAGLDETLAMLSARRVETLLVQQGFRASGVRCPNCGWLGPSGGACPTDGTATQFHEDILEPAVGAALAQSAQVMIVHEPGLLDEHGSIAALLRY